AVALSGVTNTVELVRDQEGNLFWPRFAINTIITMQPGKAYWAFSTGSNELRYPANSFVAKGAVDPGTPTDPAPNANRSSQFMVLRVQGESARDLAYPGLDLLVKDAAGHLVGRAPIDADRSAVLNV
ncbi:hypothetical protein RZS08_23435, partial [Arthrospira platensis SPKY1]|nr:hypothetical protein [Arthrospira platensis SPKY1]